MKKIGFFFLLIPVLLSFAGCDNAFFDEVKEISGSIWTFENGLDFEFTVKDTEEHYNLVLEINHTTDYPFQNLYLKIITTYPSGKKVDDILSVDLADKSGRWFGDCNSSSCSTTVDLQKNILFKDAGKYVITFFQHTRTARLKGIKGLRLIIEEADK